jgi:hypothetical protein
VCLSLFGQSQSELQIFMKMVGQSCTTSEVSGPLFGTLFGTLFGQIFMKMVGQSCTTSEVSGTLFGTLVPLQRCPAPCLAPWYHFRGVRHPVWWVRAVPLQRCPAPCLEVSGTLFGGVRHPVWYPVWYPVVREDGLAARAPNPHRPVTGLAVTVPIW